MDAALHRIETLPGAGRYAVTFRYQDSTEQTAVVEERDAGIEVAAASLPVGWRDAEQLDSLRAAVRAFDDARRSGEPTAAQLIDVAGGWDVSLGNVVLGEDGVPECTAHGPLERQGDRYVCAECGAAATLIRSSGS